MLVEIELYLYSGLLSTHDLIGLAPSFGADCGTELCRLCFKYDPIIPCLVFITLVKLISLAGC